MSQLPLDGIRVLDLTWVVSGPQATRILADLGAQVIKIEAPGRGDQMRRNPGMFTYFNRNKWNISLNLATDEGRRLFRDLVKISDLVIENFSAGVMGRWGFDYAGLSSMNPSVVYVSMPGFGHSGPFHDYQSNGPTIQALSGQTFLAGLPGMPPAGWGYSYMDHTAGHYGAMAALQALYYRNRTGRGQFVDLAQVETALSLMGVYILDATVNNRSQGKPNLPIGNQSQYPPAAPHGVYPCKGDDNWCAIAVFTEDEWMRFRTAIGDPDWANQPIFGTIDERTAHIEVLDAHVAEWTKQHESEEVMKLLQEHGIRAGMVQTPLQRADYDPQLEERMHIAEIEDAEGRVVRVDSLPMTVPARSHEDYHIALSSDENNHVVFGSLLGLREPDMNALAEHGVF